MKLSIVVPVYNTQNTLQKCVYSLINQGYKDSEIILINDGSTDNSLVLCNELKHKYGEAIIVIDKENGGLSDARNVGIAASNGDYITFVDSDDFIEPQTYASLMQKIEEIPNVDVLEYPVFVHYGSDKQAELTFKEQVFYNKNTYWYQTQAYKHSYAWNKIYRKSLFKYVKYPKGRVFEDIFTLPLLLKEAKVIATTSVGKYYYTLNNIGITSTAKAPQLIQLLQSHLQAFSIFNLKIAKTKEEKQWLLSVINIQLDIFRLSKSTPIMPNIKVEGCTLNIKLLLYKFLKINMLCKIYNKIH